MEGIFVMKSSVDLAKTILFKHSDFSGRCSSDLSIETFLSLGYSEQNRPSPTSPLFITVPGYYLTA